MSTRINTNIPSLNAQRALGRAQAQQENTFQKLSSGERINKSADDAAGLAISEKLKAEIRSSQQANRNASDGVSLIQTAEGGLNEVSNILVRLRELSIQSGTDTLGDQERAYTNLEFQSLSEEMDRIARTTNFNGVSLLNGAGQELSMQVGTSADPETNAIMFDPSILDTTRDGLGVSGLDVTTKDGALSTLAALDSAIDKVSGSRAVLGSYQNRMQSTIRNLDIRTENLSDANSRIRDTDMAKETSELAKANILTTAGMSILSQANVSSQSSLRLLS